MQRLFWRLEVERRLTLPEDERNLLVDYCSSGYPSIDGSVFDQENTFYGSETWSDQDR